jgi:hypothetical protein
MLYDIKIVQIVKFISKFINFVDNSVDKLINIDIKINCYEIFYIVKKIFINYPITADRVIMNISNGFAEIVGINNNSRSEKIFTWPKYGENKVQKIERSEKKDGQELVYNSVSEKEKSEIISSAKKNAVLEYNFSGTVSNNSSSVKPGMIFSALA